MELYIAIMALCFAGLYLAMYYLIKAQIKFENFNKKRRKSSKINYK